MQKEREPDTIKNLTEEWVFQICILDTEIAHSVIACNKHEIKRGFARIMDGEAKAAKEREKFVEVVIKCAPSTMTAIMRLRITKTMMKIYT